MKKHDRSSYITRDTIMKLLSDPEVARVSSAETATHLTDGDEYIDLESIEAGVQRAGANIPDTRNVLAKNAVEMTTWTRILETLGKQGVGSAMQDSTH